MKITILFSLSMLVSALTGCSGGGNGGGGGVAGGAGGGGENPPMNFRTKKKPCLDYLRFTNKILKIGSSKLSKPVTLRMHLDWAMHGTLKEKVLMALCFCRGMPIQPFFPTTATLPLYPLTILFQAH